MKTVINLCTGIEYSYLNSMSDIDAVCSAYCLEHGILTWLVGMISAKIRYIDSLPLIIGDKTIACGDWCIIKTV